MATSANCSTHREGRDIERRQEIGEQDISGSASVADKPMEGVQTIGEMESRLIEKTIRECDGNLSQVASRLGVSRQTLYNKIKKYGL